MNMRGLYGFLVTALVVLAIVFLYNRFSGKNIASLGVQSAA